MIVKLSRALIALAVSGLGEDGRDWGRAMEAEFGAAVEDGRPLPFAIGCLLGVWRSIPAREEGRFMLASRLLAIGCLVPMAATLIWSAAAGLPGPSGDWTSPITPANRLAAPSLLAMPLLLGVGHLGLAWAVLDRDWPRVTRLGMLNAAASATLVAIAGALFLEDVRFVLPAAILTGEMSAVAMLARWHAELSADARRSSA